MKAPDQSDLTEHFGGIIEISFQDGSKRQISVIDLYQLFKAQLAAETNLRTNEEFFKEHFG